MSAGSRIHFCLEDSSARSCLISRYNSLQSLFQLIASILFFLFLHAQLIFTVMARRKQMAPMQRINSGEVMQTPSPKPERRAVYTNGHIPESSPVQPRENPIQQQVQAPSAGFITLVICVGGIYASFLTWGLLQERITTTPYPVDSSAQPQQEYFRFPHCSKYDSIFVWFHQRQSLSPIQDRLLQDPSFHRCDRTFTPRHTHHNPCFSIRLCLPIPRRLPYLCAG